MRRIPFQGSSADRQHHATPICTDCGGQIRTASSRNEGQVFPALHVSHTRRKFRGPCSVRFSFFFLLSFSDGHSVDEKVGLSDWIKHFKPPHLSGKAICKGKVANTEMQRTFLQLVPVASGHLPLASVTSLLVVEVCS